MVYEQWLYMGIGLAAAVPRTGASVPLELGLETLSNACSECVGLCTAS